MSPRTLERNLGSRPWTGVTLVLALSLGPLSYGHEHTAPWLDESTLDRGLYVEVRHPRIIRNPRPFEVSVVVNNLLGAEPVTVREVRYSLPGAFGKVTHPQRHEIPSKRNAYRRYKAILAQMERAGERRDRASVESLRNQSRTSLRDINNRAFRDGQRVDAGYNADVGSVMNLAVEVDVVEAGRTRTLRRDVEIPIQPPLPAGTDGSWFAGDQHLHTSYSIDAFLIDGTHESLTQFAATAQAIGLDWIIITDHTNVDLLIWYRPYLFARGEAKALAYRNENDYLVLQGQEMGIGSPGRFGEAAHLLAYPRAEDSTGFLINPCPGLVFGHARCESEQVVLDRVNDHGGIGFIAHPFDSVPFFFAPWDRASGATGWAGIEIFSSSLGTLGESNSQAIQWWHELLEEISPPSGGQLAERPDYPTRFPVGIGNSDAHQPARIGNTFSYAHLPDTVHGAGMVPREDVMSAFVEGRLVASNGPLAYGEIHGAGTGQVAVVTQGRSQIALTLETTPEFGPVSDYELSVYVNGALRRTVPPNGATGFHRTVVVEEVFSPPDKFVTITSRRIRCDSCPPSELRFMSFANPIWLDLSTAP